MIVRIFVCKILYFSHDYDLVQISKSGEVDLRLNCVSERGEAWNRDGACN